MCLAKPSLSPEKSKSHCHPLSLLPQLNFVIVLSNGTCDVACSVTYLPLCLCVDVSAEFSDELRQQHGGHQAPTGHQWSDEGARPALRHGPVAHQTHLRHLWWPLLRWVTAGCSQQPCEALCKRQNSYFYLHIVTNSLAGCVECKTTVNRIKSLLLLYTDIVTCFWTWTWLLPFTFLNLMSLPKITFLFVLFVCLYCCWIFNMIFLSKITQNKTFACSCLEKQESSNCLWEDFNLPMFTLCDAFAAFMALQV